MPTFDTPEPIHATIDLAAGDLRINASERADTRVEVRPRDPDAAADVKTAEQTQVAYADGRLVVKTERHMLLTKTGAVEVTVDLPAGSHLDASSAAGNLRGEGRLGHTRVHTSYGDIQLDRTGNLELTTDSGQIGIGASDGTAAVKTANGNVRVGEVTGNLRATTTNGNIDIGQALADVRARTGHGDIRIGEVVQGAISVETSAGRLEIGVREGTAARLSVSSKFGAVKNLLDGTTDSAPADKSVEVRAATGHGDIVVRRS